MASTENSPWLLYGANGYTGELIAREAHARGLKPTLAGRRAAPIKALAEELGLPYRVFALDDTPAVSDAVGAHRAVLLAAGPFSHTSAPVLDACLRTGVHYLDITGEVAVFEACRDRSDEARTRGCVLLPGVGYDVVPSDCLAATLKAALPDATHLELASAAGGLASRGTLTTMIEGVGRGNAVRRGGKLVWGRTANAAKRIPFADKPRWATTIPWGDLVTAHQSTGIPDIAFYWAMPRHIALGMGVLAPVLPLLNAPLPQRLLRAWVQRLPPGPTPAQSARVRCQLYGRVSNAQGAVVEGWAETPEGYALTAVSAVTCTTRLLGGGVPPGMQTPALAFGAGFLQELPGCTMRVGAVRAPSSASTTG